jgi:hypothetical protein
MASKAAVITAEAKGNLLILTCACGRTKRHERPGRYVEGDLALRVLAFKEHECRKPKKVKA